MELKKVALLLFGLAGPAFSMTGITSIVASYDVGITTAKALPATPIYVVEQTGLYRLTGLATVVTPAATGTLCYNVFWTDGDTGVPLNNGPGCPSATSQGYGPNWVYTFYAQKGTPVSISTVLNNVTGSLAYNLHFRLEQF